MRVSLFLAGPLAAAAIVMLAPQSEGAVIDFEDLGVAAGTQLNPSSGVGVVTGGFNYTPGPTNGGFNDLHISNQESIWSYNGTTIGGTHDDVVLTKVGGGPFSIQSFDFAGFPTNSEVAFSVMGVRADTSTISQSFTPDGLVDGPGGVADFQTFNFLGSWSNLISVTWLHTGAGTQQGLFALDNIVVDAAPAVPEPSTLALAGLGGLLVSGRSLRRRRAERRA